MWYYITCNRDRENGHPAKILSNRIGLELLPPARCFLPKCSSAKKKKGKKKKTITTQKPMSLTANYAIAGYAVPALREYIKYVFSLL